MSLSIYDNGTRRIYAAQLQARDIISLDGNTWETVIQGPDTRQHYSPIIVHTNAGTRTLRSDRRIIVKL